MELTLYMRKPALLTIFNNAYEMCRELRLIDSDDESNDRIEFEEVVHDWRDFFVT